MKTIMGIPGEHHILPAVAEAPRKSTAMARDSFSPALRPDPSVHTGNARHHVRATVVRKIRPVPVDHEFLAWLAELL